MAAPAPDERGSTERLQFLDAATRLGAEPVLISGRTH